jgi:hypothetical protein
MGAHLKVGDWLSANLLGAAAVYSEQLQVQYNLIVGVFALRSLCFVISYSPYGSGIHKRALVFSELQSGGVL